MILHARSPGGTNKNPPTVCIFACYHIIIDAPFLDRSDDRSDDTQKYGAY